MITLLILIPLLGAVALYGGRSFNARIIALTANALTIFYAVLLWQRFDHNLVGLQFVERHLWIPSIGAEYFVAVTGRSSKLR